MDLTEIKSLIQELKKENLEPAVVTAAETIFTAPKPAERTRCLVDFYRSASTLVEQAFSELPETRLAEFKLATGIRDAHGWVDVLRKPGGEARIRAAYNRIYHLMLECHEEFRHGEIRELPQPVMDALFMPGPATSISISPELSCGACSFFLWHEKPELIFCFRPAPFSSHRDRFISQPYSRAMCRFFDRVPAGQARKDFKWRPEPVNSTIGGE
ncbi:MAG: hypothetical protein HQK57_10155 [Deltaproteobacteria bacterium]|nr:hypothetical protein [Deltaproteobacteria bacterium]